MWGIFNRNPYQGSTTDKNRGKGTKKRRKKRDKEINIITCKKYNQLNLLGEDINKKDAEFYGEELEKIRSEKPKNDVKDSVYALILVFKDLLLNPDINASNFKSDSPKSTGEPTQSGLIEHIISKNIPKLGKRNIEEILRLANQL